MTCQCDKAHDKIQLIWRRQLEQERQDILQQALQRHHPTVTSAVNWHQDAQPQQVNKRRVSSQDQKDAHIRQNRTPPFYLQCRYCNNDLEEDFSCICASQTLLRKRRDILILRGPKQQGHRQGPTPATASTSSLPSAGRVIPRMQRKEPTYSARYNPPRHKSPPVIRTNTRGNQGISLPHTHGIRQEPEDLVPEPKEPIWAQKKQGKSQPIAIDPSHHHPLPEQTWFSIVTQTIGKLAEWLMGTATSENNTIIPSHMSGTSIIMLSLIGILLFGAAPTTAHLSEEIPTQQILSCVGTWGGALNPTPYQAILNTVVSSHDNFVPITPTGAVKTYSPDGEEFQHGNEQLTRDKQHLWSLAHHPEVSAEQR